MSEPILYLGDTTLDTAASYLAGCLAHAGWSFTYIPSERPLTEADLAAPRKLIIISDYPADHISPSLQQQVVGQVRSGVGLLMIGGWESFQGSGGHWSDTPIAKILPVEISGQDDRQNCDQMVLVRCQTSAETASHPVVAGLPWENRPPLIGGYNLVKAKDHALSLLEADRYTASFSDSGLNWVHAETNPLLVVDESLSGRTAALMTDLAPHWVGPLVDWGPTRVQAQAPGAEAIEVGNLYAQFVQQLIGWTGRLND